MTQLKDSTAEELENIVDLDNIFKSRIQKYIDYMKKTYHLEFDEVKIWNQINIMENEECSVWYLDDITEEDAKGFLAMYNYELPKSIQPYTSLKEGDIILNPNPVDPVEQTPYYTMNNNSITVEFADGETIIADGTNEKFKEMQQALLDGEYDLVRELYNSTLKNKIQKLEELRIGKIHYVDGIITVEGLESNNSLSQDIIDAFESGDLDKAKKLMRFYDKVAETASARVLDNLYEFILNSDIEITEEGMIIGWKKVRDDFMDIHSGNFDNHPGQHPSMPRNQVNDDPREACSRGLHVAAFGYLCHYASCTGNRIVKVMVDPRDVVCIPFDYDFKKMRTCGYTVLEEYTGSDE